MLFSRPPAVVGPPLATYITSVADTADATGYTFTGQSLGTAAADREVVVAVQSRTGGTSITVSSLTVGGISATLEVRTANTASGYTLIEIWRAPVPTGTTGDVVVNFTGGTALRCAIDIYKLTGRSSTFATSSTGASNGGTLSLNVAANGAVIAAAASASATSAFTWTGVTERYDAATGGEAFRTSTASADGLTAATPRTVSFPNPGGSSTSYGGAAVSYA